MSTPHDIEQRSEETLRAFDGITPAEAPPFLWTRLQARSQTRLPRLLKPALAALALLTAVQVFLLLRGDQTTTRSEQIDTFINEYKLNTSPLNF